MLGAKMAIILTAFILFGLSVTAVFVGLVPAFTEDTARAVNVVHVVDTRGIYAAEQEPKSFISLFSSTPGNLNEEAEQIGGLVCGKDKQLDFVTFSVNYSCWTETGTEIGWEKSDIPQLHVERDINKESRITEVSLDTKVSTRWALGINTEEIEDFQLKDDFEELVPLGGKTSVDGWHILQFSGGKNSPTKFNLKLFWVKERPQEATRKEHLLKLRTDVDKLTPKIEDVLAKLPSWCSQFGKSTSPFNLAFLSSLPVAF